MFIGHFGAGFAAKRVDKNISSGILDRQEQMFEMNIRSFSRIISFIIFLSFVIITSKGIEGGQVEKAQDNIKYFESRALFKYLINYPEKYSKEKKYNLIIALHGGGSSPEKFMLDLKILTIENIVIFPQAPYSWLVGERLGYDWALWPSKNELSIKMATQLSERYIADLIKKCSTLYRIKNFYLLGFSQGAIYMYIAGIKNYELVDGLISLSGPGLLKNLRSPFLGEMKGNWLSEKFIKKAGKLKVFIANGKTDKATPLELGINSRDVLLKYGYDAILKSFDGGHEINQDILDAVSKWIKQKK